MTDVLHILVVDDRPDAALFLSEFLAKRGHRTQAVHQGMDALAIIQRKRAAADPYELLITDLTMPQLDGLGLLRELYRRQERLPSVLLVDLPQQVLGSRSEAEKLGCLAVLEKPVEFSRLDQLIATVLSRRGGPSGRAGDEPFFGTTRMFRVNRTPEAAPSTVPPPPPPLAMPASSVNSIADEFIGEDSPPRPAVPFTVKVQNPLAAHPPSPPQANVVRRIRTPLPPEVAGPDTRIKGYERYPSSAEIPVAPPTTSRFAAPPPPGSSASGARSRVPSDPFLVEPPPQAPPVAKPPGTGTFRRQVQPTVTKPQTAPIQRPAPTISETTTRFRRSLDGTHGTSTPPIEPNLTLRVTCTACNTVFNALRKPVPYTIPCLTCGALNTVTPQ